MKLRFDTDTQTAVLLAALKAAIRPAEQPDFITLASQLRDWPDLIERAQAHGLAPLLYRVLTNGPHECVPPTQLTELRAFWQANTVHNLKLTAELSAVLSQFEAQGVKALPFKGLPLAMLAFGALDWRQAGDMDLLIQPADVLPAYRILLERGYIGSPDLTEARNTPFLTMSHELTLSHPHTQQQIDLHWALSPRVLPYSASFFELSERRVFTAPGGRSLPTLALEDLLLYLSLHAAMHCWERMIWLGDIGGLIERHPALDWHRLLRQAQSQSSERLLLVALALAQLALGVSLPEEICRLIQNDRVAQQLAGEAMQQLSQPVFVTPETWARNRYYLRLHKGWLAKARYFRRVLFTPNVNDWLYFRLPPRYGFLYPLLRPLRGLRETL